MVLTLLDVEDLVDVGTDIDDVHDITVCFAVGATDITSDVVDDAGNEELVVAVLLWLVGDAGRNVPVVPDLSGLHDDETSKPEELDAPWNQVTGDPLR